jgi:50S ribosomal protein L16 3-hydroxylase
VLPRASFATRAARAGVRLDRRTQLLYDAVRFFVNGEAVEAPAAARAALRRLANDRELPSGAIARAATDILYRWYRNGFLHVR